MKLTRKSIFIKLIITAFLLFNFSNLYAAEKKEEKEIVFTYPYEYRVITNEIKNVMSPFQQDDYIVFTHKSGPRHIGIAFDFEDYKTIHSYMKKCHYDIDGNQKDSLYFYILELPKNIEQISYKLVIDGIWTTDPTNYQKDYNPYTGIEVSTLNIQNNHIDETKLTDKGIHFIYQGESGKIIRLAGTFTNWDSSIYSLTETKPGYYELYLPLPRGTYYYAFYNGTKSFADSSNPDRAWSTDGRETSKLVIE